ncbi:MAG: hypothetical protein ACK4GT_22085, partial [Pararhodobacter sp.]
VLRCMSLLLAQWSGTVRIGGQSVRDMPLSDRCRAVQMVFQDPYGSLHPRQSVRTTLAEPLRIHRIGDRQARMERIAEAILARDAEGAGRAVEDHLTEASAIANRLLAEEMRLTAAGSGA